MLAPAAQRCGPSSPSRSFGCNLISADRSDEPNVLLVTIDTLRADRVGAYGARDVATPTLDALAARGVLFEQAMAAVPLTLPSHASILTGQYPSTHGVRHNAVFVLRAEAETIAERFSDAGYATGAVVGAAVLDRDFGLAQGFAFYDAEMPTERASAAGFYERSAKDVTDRALTWLAGEPGPFFLWVHYYDVHAKYSPPEPFAGRASSAIPTTARRPSSTTSSGACWRRSGRSSGSRTRSSPSPPTTARGSASTARRATPTSSTTRCCTCP